MKRGFVRRFLCVLLCAALTLGTLTLAGSAGAEDYQELRYGMENDDVKAMRRRLNELGYDVSASGGSYGSQTASAVAAFQAAAGLAVNGKVASPGMQSALFASDAPRANGGAASAPVSTTPKPTDVPSDLTSKTLSYGMENSKAVEAMQKRLSALGYMKGYSGSYWKDTKKAVAAFLAAAGMSGDGSTATPAMLEKLYAIDAPRADGGQATTPKPDTTTPSSGETAKPDDPTPTPVPASTTALTYGMQNDAVKAMQIRLRELGFFNSNPTGGYFSVTTSAVEAFQKAAGLPVNGKTASVEMQNLLYSGSAPSAYSGTASYDELRLHMNNDQVRLMQRRLAALGYFDSQYVTGYYYILTARALADFQRAAGLPVNGDVATAETLKALYSNDAPAYGKTTTPTQTGSSGTTPSPYSDIKFGATGSAVKNMQRRLKDLGYLNDAADGIYGKNTGAAVSAFQAAVNLTSNMNLATVEMQNILFSDAAPRVGATMGPTLAPGVTATPTATPTPTPAPTAVAYQTLTYGMQNNELVKAMQNSLRRLGYFSDESTGNYYVATRRAVTAFEKDRGNTVDGRTVSAALLQIILTGSASTATATPTPTTTATLAPGTTATPTPTPTATPLPYTALAMDATTKSSAVKAMQQRLKDLGYLKDGVDGIYGKNTGKAVAAFQAAAKLPQNEKLASAEMQAALFSDDAPKASGATATATPSPSSRPSDKYVDLKYGNTDIRAQVYDAQVRLAALGFFTSSKNAYYDDRMAAAVEAFQKYYGYYVDGKTLTGEQQELLFTSGTKEELLAIRNNGGVTPTAKPTGSPDYSGADLSKLLKKGSSGQQVTLLTTRLIELGYLSGSPTDYYSDAVVNAVKWFQNSNSLDPDGIAGNKTLTKIYLESVLDAEGSTKPKTDITPTEQTGTADKPKISTIQTIAWGNETYFNRKTGVFKDGATATVTDVATGISYKVMRRGGYNHADVEPLTAYDTWQMYRIYGQKWSWDRRAVVVTFSNGVSSAASINGNPHGDSSISDNNMDGHTCIHFSGSHTHGTDNLDPDHQAAVSTAASTNVSELQGKINAQN